ncbi:MAG: ribokinase [Candidatus Lokiarchaeota archaeon]|nr:ribokinase [Candidatus Lokiarchaeota archaeon]
MSNRDQYVLIIGSSNMDLNIYSQRFPKPGETVTGGVFKQFLGGKGANQAVASVRSGSKTLFIGKVGIDAFGDDMLSQLDNEGVNIEHIIRDQHESSGVAFILIDETGENMISVAPGANFKLTPEEIQTNSEVIKNAKCLIVQMEIPLETIEEIFKIAKQGEVIKILNPAPLKPISLSILSNIDIIIPNEGELLQLHSLLKLKELIGNRKDIIIQASKNISRFGIKTIITTLGKKGCIIYDAAEDKITEVPAFKVRAIDTVGAGDCFNGVVASKLCQGENILTSVKYATAAASIAITRQGAQASMPYINEIEDRFKQYIANYNVG